MKVLIDKDQMETDLRLNIHKLQCYWEEHAVLVSWEDIHCVFSHKWAKVDTSCGPNVTAWRAEFEHFGLKEVAFNLELLKTCSDLFVFQSCIFSPSVSGIFIHFLSKLLPSFFEANVF